ncbi:hypothetical protein DXT63_08450 [Thermoanaerobacteraceae bacterium SP2]|nr:hypothetical protein DXT63_08450 [Thermoanaerobacteraceae bacterium SP2]
MANSIEKSLPQSKKIHGIEIKKMPLGKYLKVLQLLQDFPQEIFKALYPGKTAEEALSEMGDITFDKVLDLLPKLIALLPDKVLDIISEILDVDRKHLEEKMTPLELIEVMQEFARINKLDELQKKIYPMLEKIPIVNQMMKIGSNT